MEMKKTIFQPVLIVKGPIVPEEAIKGEVGVLIVCGICGRGIHNLALADLVLDVDTSEGPGDLIDSMADSKDEFIYQLRGSAYVVHITCDADKTDFGVRIPANEWVINKGRTKWRARISAQKKPVVN